MKSSEMTGVKAHIYKVQTARGTCSITCPPRLSDKRVQSCNLSLPTTVGESRRRETENSLSSGLKDLFHIQLLMVGKSKTRAIRWKSSPREQTGLGQGIWGFDLGQGGGGLEQVWVSSHCEEEIELRRREKETVIYSRSWSWMVSLSLFSSVGDESYLAALTSRLANRYLPMAAAEPMP